MRRHQISAIGIILFFAVFAVTSWSGENDSRKKKAAEYFQKGEILFDSEEFGKAAQAFQLAYDMSPHPAVLANIAVSYDKAGKIPEAVKTYRLYAPHAGSSKEDRKMLKRLKDLEAMIGEIAIACSVDPCTIEVNGIEQEFQNAMVVYPGSYQIRASAEGYKPLVKGVDVSAGRVVEVHLTLEALPKEEVVEEPPPVEVEKTEDLPAPKPVLGVPFWVATGVTGAAGIVTVVFAVRTSKLGSDFEKSGNTDTSLEQEGKTSRLITNIMIGVTAGAAVAALSFAIYDIVKAKKNKEKTQSARLLWHPGPGLGLGALYRF